MDDTKQDSLHRAQTNDKNLLLLHLRIFESGESPSTAHCARAGVLTALTTPPPRTLGPNVQGDPCRVQARAEPDTPPFTRPLRGEEIN